MVTVLRESGLKFVIYLDDHPPAHVHVFGDGKAKIALVTDDGAPKVARTTGMKASELRKALRSSSNIERP
jgi:DNA-binding phage protein